MRSSSSAAWCATARRRRQPARDRDPAREGAARGPQKRANNDAALASTGATLVTNASDVEDDIYQVKNQSGQDPLNFPIRVNNRLANLLSMAERGDGRPTTNMPEIFGILDAELKGYEVKLQQVWARDLAAVNKELARLGLPLLDPKCEKLEGCAPLP
jgi:hypothetical protein